MSGLDGDEGSQDGTDDPRGHRDASPSRWDDRDDDIPDGSPSGLDEWDDDPALGEWQDELPRLMARLGQLIARHGPGGVVAMARSEAERRELTAYAAGWQDAAAEFAPRVAAARRDGWLGRWRPLRVLNGPGDVIPFPVARQYAAPQAPPAAPLPDQEPYPAHQQAPGDAPGHGHDSGHGTVNGTGRAVAPDPVGRERAEHPAQRPAHERESDPDADADPVHAPGREPGPGTPTDRADTGNAGTHDKRSHDDEAHGGRDEAEPAGGERSAVTRARDGARGQPRGGRSGQSPRPSLPAKSRWSRSPTIPRLAPPQRPPDRGPDGTLPPDPPA